MLTLLRMHFGYCEDTIPKAIETDSALRCKCHFKTNLNHAAMIYDYHGVHTILCKRGPWSYLNSTESSAQISAKELSRGTNLVW